MTIEELEKVSQDLRDEVVKLSAETDAQIAQLDEALSMEAEFTEDAEITIKARLLLETYSEVEQETLKAKVEDLVSAGLQTIFGGDYRFRIESKTLRGQAAMDFTITKGLIERDPMDSHGGGLVNIVSLVLRLVIVALTPGMGRTVVLDEPFAQVSQGYIEAVGDFCRQLVDSTGIQLLIVSHEPEIAERADQAYRLFSRDGQTMIERSE